MKVVSKKFNKQGIIVSVVVSHEDDRFILTPMEYLKLCLEGYRDEEPNTRSVDSHFYGRGDSIECGL